MLNFNKGRITDGVKNRKRHYIDVPFVRQVPMDSVSTLFLIMSITVLCSKNKSELKFEVAKVNDSCRLKILVPFILGALDHFRHFRHFDLG